MEQIADFIKQLYEYFYLKKNEIKKLQKNISSELLASFGRQLTKEDIFLVDINIKSSTEINIAKKMMSAKKKMQIYTQFFQKGINAPIQCG